MGRNHSKEMLQLRSERFVSAKSSDLKQMNLNPIYGYQHLHVRRLEEAVEGLDRLVPGLMTYVKKAKEDCNRSSSLLTHDESAAIYLYSMPIPFFSTLNATLRKKNRDALKPWFGYLKLFITALEKLPYVNTVVWRGVSGDIGSDFVDGSTETWWSVNSCSTDLNVVELYLGKTGTVFAIAVVNGKDISNYSTFKEEHEVVLLPGSALLIKSKPLSFEERLFIVHLEEKSGKSGQASNPCAAAGNQIRSDNSNEAQPLSYKESDFPLHHSLDLSSVRSEPWKVRSLHEFRSYNPLKIISTNDEILLLYGDKQFFLLNNNLETVSTLKNNILSSLEILDIAWSSLLCRFIAVTEKNAYIFDPKTCKLSCVENVQLRRKEKKFISCTCTGNTLFISTVNDNYPFHVDQYNLPDFTFFRQYTVSDLIEAKLNNKNVSKFIDDKRKISTIRANRGRLAVIMKIKYKHYLYVVNMTKEPFEAGMMPLPSSGYKINRIASTGEWLMVCDDYDNNITQISLDREFKTEYEAKKKYNYDKVKFALMFGPSSVVIVCGDNLEMYQV
ncbi:unnamed protein product [Adineta ricciae]|uniref:NAD(P)(+)--arginine ADP-ribosyltransferase n=1 Tax=Adineta ricciae TaxID=249248 RepID=A0A815JYG2_ADIRI|nr:unnamed protein product [Adineta ricciae]CAF1388440.1 unnamed protein product [Adineta ricciae]